jgi:hypothetical protein
MKKARREFFAKFGEIKEGDPWYEQRISAFTEWYLLEWKDEINLRPIDYFLKERYSSLNKEDQIIFKGLAFSYHSLFKVIDRTAVGVIILDLLHKALWEVVTQIPEPALTKDDIIQARLIPFIEEIIFGEIIFHPREARARVITIVQRLLSEQRTSEEILAELAKMRLKYDQYQKIKIEYIYHYPPLKRGKLNPAY